MKIEVDLDKCVGGGQCVLAAPDLFDQRDSDGMVVLLRTEPPEDEIDAAREAAALCPAAAIALVEG